MADDTIVPRDTAPGFWRRPSRSLKPALRWERAAEGERPHSAANARSAAMAMLVAFAVLALFNSQGLQHFTRDLPGNAFTDTLVNAADEWHELMERLGPARLGPAVRLHFGKLRDLTW